MTNKNALYLALPVWNVCQLRALLFSHRLQAKQSPSDGHFSDFNSTSLAHLGPVQGLHSQANIIIDSLVRVTHVLGAGSPVR